MPSFESSLEEGQVDLLIDYIREVQSPCPPTWTGSSYIRWSSRCATGSAESTTARRFSFAGPEGGGSSRRSPNTRPK